MGAAIRARLTRGGDGCLPGTDKSKETGKEAEGNVEE